MTVEEQVKRIVDKVVAEAMRKEFEDVMQNYRSSLSPELNRVLRTIFECGVQVGSANTIVWLAENGKQVLAGIE
jgi:hypothetical protein